MQLIFIYIFINNIELLNNTNICTNNVNIRYVVDVSKIGSYYIFN